MKSSMDLADALAPPQETTILEMREVSRRLVRELGFMRPTLADSDLAPSAVHAILEIGTRPGMNAKALGHILRLDKSNTSRQVGKLESSGLVERRAESEDARSSNLYLTSAGQKIRKKIDRYASNQVSSALSRINTADQQELLRALALYVNALAQNNMVDTDTDNPAGMLILEGYQSGCIGDIAGLHARFYSAHWHFGAFFEQKVATELASFAGRLPSDGKALWTYSDNGRTLASIAIDGDHETGIAHLRWFIVDDSLRGSGIGRQLMAQAMQFVDQRFSETYLWTFKGLDAARHLYESFGFQLTNEEPGLQWGTSVTEQRFGRKLPRP